MAYASDTTVPVEKSRAEIETIINRHGASKFGYSTDENQATIGFVRGGVMIKFALPLPSKQSKAFHEYRLGSVVKLRSADAAYKLWEQACRSRWRAMLLCIKAKLEAVEVGITSFEQEFLAHIVLPNGRTVGENALPQIAESLRSGQMPTNLLGYGG